jgi:hypothetical protein
MLICITLFCKLNHRRYLELYHQHIDAAIELADVTESPDP